MSSLIKCWSTAAMIVGIMGLAVPALAQTSDAGVVPILISGDQSPKGVAAACGISEANIRGSFITPSTTTGTGFAVQIAPGGDTIAFTDTSSSAPDQFNGTLGIEAVGVRRNGTYVYCYKDTVHDARLDAPGSGAPNQVTVVWGPGPCPLTSTQVGQVCAIYNPTTTPPTPPRVDFIQGHQIEASQPINLCGCQSDVSFCNPALPSGTPGACIPSADPSANVFQGSEPQNSATVGSGTCKQVALPTVGGSLRYTTVCN